MRQILNRSLLTVAAASSILAAAAGYASADSTAEGAASGSPGVLSGNSVQAPVDVPVNVCGNTVDVAGVGNPAFGNHCAHASLGAHSLSGAHSGPLPGSDTGAESGYGHGSGDPDQYQGHTVGGTATGSPGVLSGNAVDVPVHVPVNVCGNTVDPVGVLNPAMGNSCADTGQASSIAAPPPVPPGHAAPPDTHRAPHTGTPDVPPAAWIPAPRPAAQLAETGADARRIGAAGATSAALLLGGAMLYRRGTRPAHAGRTR
ncbi:chaplin [Actinacidiphila sp. ITFR-21]|uniref:chaplin n=1 Tax=Actinacidiphila sp. ITFR-21 TaxID=3075199 RepID=UPI00288B595A|nr:chaplin family protein [Streptomyces sp. ITFR-21]WNI16482.1 chaplin family protein [Streptomyces sp. ITFR-21]